MKKLFVTAALTLTTALAFAAGPNLINNGDFETYSGTVPNGGYTTVNAGSTAIADWTVSGTSVDLILGAYGAISGVSVDMLGTPGPGSLSQSFLSVLGQEYTLSFDLSSNGGGGGGSGYLGVSLNGAAATAYNGTVNFTSHSQNFFGTGNMFSLTSTSSASGNSGAVLDNVSVTAIPEPESYAMFLAGLGVMGAIAVRRRKSKTGV